MSDNPRQNKELLDREYGKVQQKQREIESQKLINANTLAQERSKLIGQMFETMKNLGVDMENLESIRDFLGKLEKMDPDLHELFTFAFNGLAQPPQMQGVPGMSGPEQPQGVAPNLMDKYKNLSGEMMRNNTNEGLPEEIRG